MKPPLVLSFVALALCLASARAAEEEAPETMVAVQTAKIVRATLHRYVTVYGVVEPAPAQGGSDGAGSRLAAALAGVISAVECREGQKVKKGDLLFCLDSRPADVAAEFAKLNLDRQQKLLPLGGSSEKAVQEAEQQLATAWAQQKLLCVEAPFDGVITRISVQPGEAVDPATILGEILDPARLVVTAAVPASEMDGIKPGMPAELIVDGRVLPSSGKVTFISPRIDPQSNTALVRFALPQDAGLHAGAVLEARVVSEEKSGVLAVPTASVYTDNEGQTTLSVVENDTASRKTVKAGIRDRDLVEVEGEGISEGQIVVTVGSYALPERTKVRVVNPEGR